jgi:beta-1,4-mannosyltransferase
MFDTSTPFKFIFYAPCKAVFQLASLLHMLLHVIPPAAGFLLLQNPPAIPTLVVAKVVSVLRGQKLVTDWHNFGYTILGMKLGGHPIVWISKMCVSLTLRLSTTRHS